MAARVSIMDRIRAFRQPQQAQLVPTRESVAYAVKAEQPVQVVPIQKGKLQMVRKIGLSYAPRQSFGTERTKIFEAPLFNLTEVRVAYEVDSFVRRAVDRHIDVFMKEGYAIKGSPKSVEYLRRRFLMMAMMTGKPTSVFMSECVSDYVKYHNVFLVKGRFKDGEGIPGMRLRGVTDKHPISAYFKVAAPTISVARERVGNEVVGWMQTVDGPLPKMRTAPSKVSYLNNTSPSYYLIEPKNMIHMYKAREEGEIFGAPFILPAIQDVKTLREVEEYVVELVYLFSNPIVEWLVGSKEKPGEEADLADAEARAREGGVAGIYILPGDQEISVKGAPPGVAAIDYLKYFESRVFTGLGTSETQMGRGNTANRSTAGNMTNEFFDRIRGYHRDFESFFTECVIFEMLLEGGFDPFDEDETAWLEFFDPDAAAQMERENQAVQMFTNYLIDIDEAREKAGYDPWDDKTQNERGYYQRIKMPLAIIQAVDEPYTDAAKQAMGKGGTPGQIQKNPPENPPAGTPAPAKKGSLAAPKATPSKTRPSNQHGPAKPQKGKGRVASADVTVLGEKVSENGLGVYRTETVHMYNLMRTEIIKMVAARFNKDSDNFNLTQASASFQAFIDGMKTTERTHLWPLYVAGIKACLSDMSLSEIDMEKMGARFEAVLDEWAAEWKSFTKLIYKRMTRALRDADSRESAVSFAQSVFSVLDYIGERDAKTHFYRARNFGYAYAAYNLGANALTVHHYSKCPKCEKIERISLDGISVYKTPPFHPNCECEVEVEK
ncbi:MAG: hypothetical protein WC712_13350 [Candidatus Brocadiia bacterium]